MRRSVGGSPSRVRRVEVSLPKEAEITMAHQSTTIPTATFRVSVLCSRKTGRVLFLEAGKDFVDTLLSFLLLPVGTINMLSRGDVDVKPLGGISCIFESVKDLDPSFLHVDRENLVAPKPAAGGSYNPTGLLQSSSEAASCTPPKLNLVENLPRTFYRCFVHNCTWLTTKQGGPCVTHGGYTYSEPMPILPKDLEDLREAIVKDVVDVEKGSCSSGEGFVRENITYMVTDNLEIMPSTTIRSMNVLNKLKVATLADLESTEKTVSITQVLQLPQAALTSSTCLNDVFGMK